MAPTHSFSPPCCGPRLVHLMGGGSPFKSKTSPFPLSAPPPRMFFSKVKIAPSFFFFFFDRLVLSVCVWIHNKFVDITLLMFSSVPVLEVLVNQGASVVPLESNFTVTLTLDLPPHSSLSVHLVHESSHSWELSLLESWVCPLTQNGLYNISLPGMDRNSPLFHSHCYSQDRLSP
mgnify:CR=1 FL=1